MLPQPAEAPGNHRPMRVEAGRLDPYMSPVHPGEIVR